MRSEQRARWVLMRAADTPEVRSTPGVSRTFLTRAEVGSQHLSTGTTRFEAGAGLFWHMHPHDESVTVLEGAPICEVGGVDGIVEAHPLQPLDTTFIPAYTPHRFINPTDQPAIIHWSYPTARIERCPVNPDGSPLEGLHCADSSPGERSSEQRQTHDG
ncbi:MAG: hypothetical protein OHK0015_45360 [Chloroflexi bacterium OHK40]